MFVILKPFVVVGVGGGGGGFVVGLCVLICLIDLMIVVRTRSDFYEFMSSVLAVKIGCEVVSLG